MRYAALLLLTLGACKTGKVDSFGGEALRAIAAPPSSLSYEQVAVADGFFLPVRQMEGRWSGPVLVDDRMLYDVEEWEVREEERIVRERLRVFYGPQGFGYVGTLDEGGALTPWEPPQVVLPPHPEVGMRWTATHRKGDRTSVRTCNLGASDLCEGGLVSVCDSVMDEGQVVLRDHFCPGVGHVGFEALVVRENQPSLRMWSRDLVRDGVQVGPREEDELLAP
ncbi:MAG: hypothetical protein JXX28_00455 [Deltaproteobacteria bacterium]|nr:hypothetical protein [Deltaproteobacteria bacterium]